MKIAINNDLYSYSKRWVEYCEKNNIPYKMVDCYASDIINQIGDCDVFMWHHHHANYKDVNFAKQLLFSLEQSGKRVFPDFKSAWHFDDKLGQKYLFEAHGIQSAKSYAFYDKKTALDWAEKTSYPKIFKLRGGASSSNVSMVSSKKEAFALIKKAFGKGFPLFNAWQVFKDTLKLYRQKKARLSELEFYLKRTLFPGKYNFRFLPRQKGYVFFQDFIPNNGFDYRVQITGKKAICMLRYARENDFRASGGHHNKFDKSLITKDVIDFAFSIYKKLDLQTCALDIVRHKETAELFLIECSYCYGIDDDEFEHGYWDEDGNWYKEKFDSRDWMIEAILPLNNAD